MMIRVVMNMSGISFFLFSKPSVMKLYEFIVKLSYISSRATSY